MAENGKPPVDGKKDPTRSEALFQEFLRRQDTGEEVTPSEYFTRYPELEDDLKRLFEKLQRSMSRQPEAAPPPVEIRKPGKVPGVLGDFKIIKKIGSGGMGTVYEAEQISLKRRVAIKVLSTHLSLSEEAVLKFRREAMAGGRQSHPAIVAIHGVGEHEGTHYIVQELIEGGKTLADRLFGLTKRSTRSHDYIFESAEFVAHIADALFQAHETGVIHRDIKPSNILITRTNVPKITDFGLAKVEDALALSRTGNFAGTPYYMSPEQAASQRIGIDHRTDIFSLGVTLYEMLTLTRPFNGKTKEEVLKKILLKDPADPRRINPHIPRDLAVICLKALEKDPGHRYPTMDVLSKDLNRFLTNDVILTTPPGPLFKTLKRIKRSPGRATAWAVGLALLLTMFFFSDELRSLVTAEGPPSKTDLKETPPMDLVEELRWIESQEPFLFENRDELALALERIRSCIERAPDDRFLYQAEILQKKYQARLSGLNTLNILSDIEARGDDLKGNEEALKEAESALRACGSRVPESERDRFQSMERWISGELCTLRIEPYLHKSPKTMGSLDLALKALEDYENRFKGSRDLAAVSSKIEEIKTFKGSLIHRLARNGFTFKEHKTFSCGNIENTVEIYLHGPTGLEFVLIPGGSFMMGSPAAEIDRDVDEGPRFRVTVQPFLLCRTECTVKAWNRISKGTGTAAPDRPVTEIDWETCLDWCTKANLRLPSESEWEYACRAGTSTAYFYGEEEGESDDFAWLEASPDSGAHPVGRKRPNAFGLFDMQINVWEWCADRYHRSYSGAPADGLPWNDLSGSTGRVCRGGGWYYGNRPSRAARRKHHEPGFTDQLLGFRPAYSTP